MLALFSSPIRRWLLATLLLPLVATVLARIGTVVQRRNDGNPTRVSRILLGTSGLARRLSGGRSRKDSGGSGDGATPSPAPTDAATAPA